MVEEEGSRDEVLKRKLMGKVNTLPLPLSAQKKEAAATIIQQQRTRWETDADRGTAENFFKQ